VLEAGENKSIRRRGRARGGGPEPHLAGGREGWRSAGGSGGATALGTGEGNEEQVRVRDERVREMGLVGVDSTGLGPSGPIHLIWSG
jgi:hypothetical protein